MYVSFDIIKSACTITATSLSVKLYRTLRRHINQFQVPQVAQNDEGESVQRKRKSAMASLYVYLVFIVCYLPNNCVNYYRCHFRNKDRCKAFEVLHSDPVVSEFNP